MKRDLMKRDEGFTIIELLIVTAIIGILAALAIPNYAMFKGNALDATAASDARNIAPAAELVVSGNDVPDPDDKLIILQEEDSGPITGIPGATKSPGTFGTVTLEPNHYTIEVEHPGGSLCYRIDSTTGWQTLNSCGQT